MTLLMPGGPYRVDESPGFQDDWSRGAAEGWINPMADPVTLQAIKRHLSTRPLASGVLPDAPANVRFIYFPRSAASEQGRVMLRFSIIEDDRLVVLEGLVPIPP